MLLINGDCIEEINRLIVEDIRVDLTVTSPPYDKLRTYKNSLVWNENVWKQTIEKLYKITADGGVVVWIVGDSTSKGNETGTSFKQALYFKEVGFNLHDTMIYHKKAVGACGSKNGYNQAFEYMFVLTKGKIKTFNPIKDLRSKRAGKPTKYTKNSKSTSDGYSSETHTKIAPEGSKRQNLWHYNIGFSSGDDKTKHPAVFPEKLAQDHILSWSNEGDTIFDPFMGSGTTGKMAILNNRKFIGIEKVEEYFEVSVKRITEAELWKKQN